MKNNRGITLIALTVTIIVLLILATVSIATLSGDTGLLKNTQESKEEAEIREEKEQVSLAAVAAMSNHKWGNVTKKNLQNELNKNVGKDNFTLSGEGPFIVTYTNSGRSYEVAVNGDVKGVGTSNIPEGEDPTPEDKRSKVDTTGKWIYIINAEGYVEITGYDFSEYVVKESSGRYMNDHYIDMGGEILVIPETLEDPATKEQKTVVKLDWKESKLPEYQVYNKNVTSFTLIISDVQKIEYSNEIKEIYNNLNGWDIKFESATEVKLPINLEILGDYALTGCGAESITIPDSVTEIGYAAFRESLKLKSITIPNNVTVIEGKAFYCCEALERVVLSEKITEISYLAFAATGLTNITIPNSVTSIGDGAFEGCGELKNIDLSDNVTTIGQNAFYNCDSLEKITFNEKVAEIQDEAFYGCRSLNEIIIPASVTNIGNDVFRDCENLETLKVDTNNVVYDSRNECNAIIKTGSNTLMFGFKNTIIPSGITTIGSNAFKQCSDLTEIIIPGSVTSIESNAFDQCRNLTDITISEGVTNIGASAFSYCYNLTDITIPASVTNIGERAFQSCSNLTNVIILGSEITIGNDAFYSWGNSTTINFPNGINKEISEDKWGASKITISGVEYNP